MILQRVASAIKRQDWFQVTIEILIVVIGIFLGLQVQAWYDARSDEAEEKLVLNALASDYRANIEMMDIQLIYANEKMITINELMLRSAGGQGSQIEIDVLISNLYRYFPSTFQAATAESYLTIGKHDLIKNRAIRDQIIALPKAIVRLKGFADLEKEYATETLFRYLHDNTYIVQITNNKRGNPGTGDYGHFGDWPVADALISDHSKLLSNKKFIAILDHTYWLLTDIVNNYSSAINSFQKTLVTIETELKTSQ